MSLQKQLKIQPAANDDGLREEKEVPQEAGLIFMCEVLEAFKPTCLFEEDLEDRKGALDSGKLAEYFMEVLCDAIDDSSEIVTLVIERVQAVIVESQQWRRFFEEMNVIYERYKTGKRAINVASEVKIDYKGLNYTQEGIFRSLIRVLSGVQQSTLPELPNKAASLHELINLTHTTISRLCAGQHHTILIQEQRELKERAESLKIVK